MCYESNGWTFPLKCHFLDQFYYYFLRYIWGSDTWTNYKFDQAKVISCLLELQLHVKNTLQPLKVFRNLFLIDFFNLTF